MPIATLVDAMDLNAWSNRREAQSLLPRLIRRLVHATSERVERVGFPADEGVQLGGYDGVVRVGEGNAFVPEGTSVWELGTNRNVRGKADEDYEKRRDDPLGLDPSKTSFVFVTPRRWGGKDDWVTSREAEDFWREVRAYDADDLDAWLELAPGVHVWLSFRLGKHPEGARDLAEFWAAWSGVTNPPMSTDLVVSGREEESERLRTWLGEEPSALTLRAESREEALAFFAATLHQLSSDERAPYLSRGVVAEDARAWRQLTTTENALLLVPMFEARDEVAGAARDGHHVLVPLGKAEGRSSAMVEIPRPRRQHAKDALLNMGLAEPRAERLARLARRSPMALRRELAVLREVHRPEWAKPAEAGPILPVVLVGAWEDSNDADQEVVARLAGTSYGEVERALGRWVNESDPPVRRVGDKWLLSSKEDAWTLLAGLLARGELDRLESTVLEVLGELDPAFDLPADQRWMARALGRSLSYSGLLREGLADTLALMGARSEVTKFADFTSSQERASRMVRRLLTRANKDWRLWGSLSNLLPLMAEAAPEEFLEAVAAGLSGEQAVLANLFSDADAGPFSIPPHTGLLWALENLAWFPEYLGHVSVLLAKLARVDPGGRWVNRPQNSLREIFLCWLPHTAASLDRRAAVLDAVRTREPEISWRLLCDILPGHHSSSHPTHQPRYREWVPEPPPRPTPGEIQAAVGATVDRLLEDVGVNGRRWRDLVEELGNLPREQHDAIVERLLSVEVGSFARVERLLVWGALRAKISHHREFPDAEWAMPAEDVDRLQSAYERFEPDDLISRYAWLFSDRPDLLEPPRGGWSVRREAVGRARSEALREVYAHGGLESLVKLAARVERPLELGRTLGANELLEEGEEDELLRLHLGSFDAPRNDLACGLVLGRWEAGNLSWAEAKLSTGSTTWSPEQRSQFFRSLRFEGHTWDLLETADPETQRLYWTQSSPYGLANAADCRRAITKFLEYDRPYAAVDTIAIHLGKEEAGIPPAVASDALERAVLTPPPQGLHLSSFAYNAGELLDFLAGSGEIDQERIAGLEWALIPLLEHSGRPPRTLHHELSRNPEFFAEVVELVYKPEDEEPPELSEEDLARARLGDELLKNWREIPGREEDGSIDSEALRSWVCRAREATRARQRGRIGNQLIGEVLVYSPKGSDEAWPDVPVRDLLEELEDETVERGMEIAIYNSRGVVSRDLSEGGEQERRLVETYQGYARLLSDRWPRTTALLRRVAEYYASQARQEDLEAELREDF